MLVARLSTSSTSIARLRAAHSTQVLGIIWPNHRHARALSQLVQIPLIFTGLLVTLWTWKSLTLIIFQNKIVYMPYLGRHEQLKDYSTLGVAWHRETVKTSDGVNLVLCHSQLQDKTTSTNIGRRVKVIYLQGNASSTPPRLPPLSKILLAASKRMPDAEIEIYTLSYRGYWESSGRPSEAGLLLDVRESLSHILSSLPSTRNDCLEVIIWGHSIGSSLALLSLLHLYTITQGGNVSVKVILETPFDSIASILKALYPQKWLPYHYLSPFLRTRLDVPLAMQHLHHSIDQDTGLARQVEKTSILLIAAEKDEIVPAQVSESVLHTLQKYAIGSVTKQIVRGGLHQDCLFKPEMHRFVIDFIMKNNEKQSKSQITELGD